MLDDRLLKNLQMGKLEKVNHSKSPTRADLVNLGKMASMVDPRVLASKKLNIMAAVEALDA